MKQLYIIGAGGFGRELHGYLHEHPDHGHLWRYAGFVDDNPLALAHTALAAEPLIKPADLRPAPDVACICAVGQPAIKEKLCQPLRERGLTFMTFVHPSARVGPRVILGEGCVLAPGVVLTCDIVLGDFVLFNVHASAGHDVWVGHWSSISGHVDLTGGVTVEDRAFLGSHATIVPGKTVGAGACVGAGSVVLQSVKPGTRVFGNPARPFEG